MEHSSGDTELGGRWEVEGQFVVAPGRCWQWVGSLGVKGKRMGK